MLRSAVSGAKIDQVMRAAGRGDLRGILDSDTEPRVGMDLRHRAASCMFDATLTAVMNDVVDGGALLPDA
ncbi:MAG TPA: hypothetical protein VMA37_12005 [Acetobacteraceae bacterium]|nr:hypothetical protein [Acetobacteraceae bacterium]